MKQEKPKLEIGDNLKDFLDFLILALLFVVVIFFMNGCNTYQPSIESTYKAKCVGVYNDTARFEYYYNCKKKSPCAIQFDAVGEYEVGRYYWVKYRQN